MKAIVDWDDKKDKYIIDNYLVISTKKIAKHLETTPNIIKCRAFYLRKKGMPVAKHSFVSWKNEQNKEKLMNLYGTMPTHKVAERLNIKTHTVYRTVTKMNISFRGNNGCYTFSELSQILSVDEKIFNSWVKLGLKVSSFAKNGLTRPRKHVSKSKKFHALINPKDLKKFFEFKPEAYNINRLDKTTKHLLELSNLKIKWRKKRLCCKKCNTSIWVNLYEINPKCPKCKRYMGKWSTGKYRT